jgi:hypothetical protein
LQRHRGSFRKAAFADCAAALAAKANAADAPMPRKPFGQRLF